MFKCNARELASMDRDMLWNIPDGPMVVVFDDGELQTNARATILSAYVWKFYNVYPKAKTRMDHHLNRVGLGKQQMLGQRTHLDMLGRVQRDVMADYRGELDREASWRLVYQITNEIYNDFTYRLEAYATTINALDFVEIMRHPEIAAINDNLVETPESVDSAHTRIRQIMTDKTKLSRNPIARSARAGHTKIDQVVQIIGPRGYITDIDSHIFRHPVLRSYAAGLRSLHDHMIESRFAAKSLFFQQDPLKQAEYFNRKLQLLCDTLATLHRMDCGSTDYLSIRVTSHELSCFVGKYYMTPEGLKELKQTDRHLIGEVLNFRSVGHCKHPDPRGICSVCFGALSQSVPDHTNIGHVSSTAVCAKISQKVLSVKHNEASSNTDDISIGVTERKYIEAADQSLRLASHLTGEKVTLVILANEAPHLSDITQIEQLDTVTLSRISELSEVQFIVERKKGIDQMEIMVAAGKRRSSLSHHALKYIKRKGWTATSRGDFAIDLSEWDVSLPLFELPLKHVDMIDYMNRIQAVIRSTTSSGKRKVRGIKSFKSFNNFKDALMEMYELISTRLTINIAHIEIITYASAIRSSNNLDYRLPLHGNAVEFGTFTDNMSLRSMGAMMAYQSHQKMIASVRSYIVTNRPDHPIDILMPARLETQDSLQ